MHELSIALSIIEGMEETLEAHAGARVAAVHIRLGPLSGVVGEALAAAYELAAGGTDFEGSQLLIEDVPIRIYCSKCAGEQAAISMQHMACAICGTASSDVRHGRELEVCALELLE